MAVKDGIDYSQISPDLMEKMKKWEANKPEAQQVSALNDLQAVLEHLVITMNDNQDSTEETVKNLGALLTDMRTSLASLDKKEAPESPDYAAPVVSAVKDLETALTKALAAVDVKPEFTPTIHVDAPQVNLSPPEVDLKGVEQAVAGLSTAFADAIASIPQTPETDLSPLSVLLQQMSEQLTSIDNATRMKPLPPSTIKVQQLDGSPVRLGLFSKSFDEITVNYTDATKAIPTTIIAKLGGLTQQTITVTSGGTSDDYLVS